MKFFFFSIQKIIEKLYKICLKILIFSINLNNLIFLYYLNGLNKSRIGAK